MTGRAGFGVAFPAGEIAAGPDIFADVATGAGEISVVVIFSVGTIGICSFSRYFLLTALMRFSF